MIELLVVILLWAHVLGEQAAHQARVPGAAAPTPVAQAEAP